MCSCHSIPECCVMFSGVKLSMGYFFFYFKEIRYLFVFVRTVESSLY